MRYATLVAVMVLAVVSSAVQAETGMEGSRPNVIFFLGDDQNRFDHAAYGNESVPTPTSDLLAKESLVFDRAYTGQAICAPSRSMLATGLYPVRGCFINHTEIREGVNTLPHYLKELGYTVILAGKSHLGPREQYPWAKHIPSAKKKGVPRGWIPIEKLDEFLAAPGPNPFCILVASEFPHPPYIPETPYKPEDVSVPPSMPNDVGTRRSFTRYYRNIQEKEAELAELLKVIDKHGMKENSVLFFADDHGLHRGKSTAYDTGLNIAFMVRWPAKLKPGRSEALVSFADFVPTVIELAGGEVPKGLDGMSLLPLLEGKAAKHHDYVYGVTVNQGIKERHVFPQRSAHDGRYHYIHSFNTMERAEKNPQPDPVGDYFLKQGAAKHPEIQEEMLFDTKTDPHELTNLADKADMVEIKERLKTELFRWMKTQNDYLKEDGPLPILEVKKRYSLDQMDHDYYSYAIPKEKVGSLKGKAIDPHAATSPRAR